MYKLVAVDIDCTLLNDQRVITPRTHAALKAVVKKGVKVVLVSGRAYMEARPILQSLGLMEQPVITVNGAIIVNPEGEEILFEDSIPTDLTHDVICDLKGREQSIVVAFGLDTYVDEIDNCVELYKSYTNRYPNLVTDLREYCKGKRAAKICLCGQEKDLREIIEYIDVKYKGDIEGVFSMPTFVELHAPAVSKGNALKRLADYYEYDRSEIIAFGDGENDIPMLEYAGLGVAMDNAMPAAKRAADKITASNNEDGIAVLLEQLFGL